MPYLSIYGKIAPSHESLPLRENRMDNLKKSLEQREKPELIAIIIQILRQEPDLHWLLTTPLPIASSRTASINPKIYQKQILAAISANDNQHKRKRGEVQRRLTAIKMIAEEFAANENYSAALTIYEVLVNEIIHYFNDYQDEYVAFCVTLTGCIDGLDTCFAGEEDNQKIRMRVLRTLFVIYRFYTDSAMDLDEDIPSLLIGNTAPEERQVIAGWVRDALAKAKDTKWSSSSRQQRYSTFLLALEKY